MSDVVRKHEFSTTDWELLADATSRVTVKNPGGYAVAVCQTEDNNPPASDIPEYDTITIGGVSGMFISDQNQYVWGRCTGASGYVRILTPFDATDPEADLTQLAQAINNVETDLNKHKADTDNPHKTTKKQVGLGNLPNAKTDDPTVNNSEILATSAAVNKVAGALGSHIADTDNPHKTTKKQVGLGNVPNYSVGTESDAVNKDVNDKFMTPYLTYIAITRFAEIAFSIPPQRVLAGKTVSRPVGWNYTECSPPTQLISIVSATNNTCKVNKGLVVSYAVDSKSKMSLTLANDIQFSIPKDYMKVYYIYVDLNALGVITGAGYNANRPLVGPIREGSVADTFVPQNCQMLDPSGKEIYRVYIGRVYQNLNGTIMSVSSVPLGDEYITPMSTTVNKNSRYLVENPFIENVEVTAKVFYNSMWGETGWNDQIGIAASFSESQPDVLIVQSGLMGTLACGQESGSSFGLTFPTVTSALKTRLHVKPVTK